MIRYVLVPSEAPRALEITAGQKTLIEMVRTRLGTDDRVGRGSLFRRPSPLGWPKTQMLIERQDRMLRGFIETYR